MMTETKTIVYLDRAEVVKALEQFIRRELDGDGRHYDSIEIKTDLQIPDFRAECKKDVEL